MSIKFISDDIFDIYIIKDKISNINFNNKNELEKYLKGLFSILNKYYSIDIEGFYDICIYLDKYYGIIIHIEKEGIDYYRNEIDMKISIINKEFLYEVSDINKEIINKVKIHIINNNMYLEITSDISNKDMMYLIENSNSILYDYSK